MSIWDQWKLLRLNTHTTTIRKKVVLKLWPQGLTSKCRWKLFTCGRLPREGLLDTQNALHLHFVRPKSARVGVLTGQALVLDLEASDEPGYCVILKCFWYKAVPTAEDYDKLCRKRKSWRIQDILDSPPSYFIEFYLRTQLVTKIMVSADGETEASCLFLLWIFFALIVRSSNDVFFVYFNWPLTMSCMGNLIKSPYVHHTVDSTEVNMRMNKEKLITWMNVLWYYANGERVNISVSYKLKLVCVSEQRWGMSDWLLLTLLGDL